MPLESGASLGPYEILAPLGAGGMGEVYRARDPKLGREVAIKVLPEEVRQHPDKLARFEREAKLLASLNHPGIATLHGLEDADGQPFLVMELVEGETLAERLARGPIPLREALDLAQQVAEALEAAHEKGVIHRDLKPANVKVDPEGRVKVLDFGLAKAFAEETPESDSSLSPTLSREATQAGIILGTASYMSPEQAKGRAVDRRSDVFSFGVVLYEMLTGRKAFAGEDVSEILARILTHEPDWAALPADLPPLASRLLRRCLVKDRRDRLRDIGDARVELHEIRTAPPSVATRAPSRVLPWVVAAVLGVALLADRWSHWSATPARRTPVRLSAAVSVDSVRPVTGRAQAPALSPDGRLLAFQGRSPDGTRQLYLRPLDSLRATPIPGTEEGRYPFFSPDGQWLGFSEGGRLQKVPIAGGAAVTIAADAGLTGSWGRDGTIVYPIRDGLYRVPPSGGEPVRVTEHGERETHRWPWLLPGGKAALFTVADTDAVVDDWRLEAVSFETGERTVVHEGGTFARYASSGHLLYVHQGTLFARPFDAERLRVTGEARPVAEDVAVQGGVGAAAYAVSESGTLVYLPANEVVARRRLVWVDRQGREDSAVGPVRAYDEPRLSPDERRVAASIFGGGLYDTWLLELERGALTRLTLDGNNRSPVWSPDGTRVLFASTREGQGSDIFWKRADGSGGAEQLTPFGVPTSISSDGKTVVFWPGGPDDGTGINIGVLRLDAAKEPEMWLRTPFDENNGILSPDDRWLAYVSNESGREEVYVQPFPGPGPRVPISTAGGGQPLWSRDGRELFYRNGDAMMAVEISPGPELTPGPPRLLFERSDSLPPTPVRSYDVASDGRFLMVGEEPGNETLHMVVVLDWFEELSRLAPSP